MSPVPNQLDSDQLSADLSRFHVKGGFLTSYYDFPVFAYYNAALSLKTKWTHITTISPSKAPNCPGRLCLHLPVTGRHGCFLSQKPLCERAWFTVLSAPATFLPCVCCVLMYVMCVNMRQTGAHSNWHSNYWLQWGYITLHWLNFDIQVCCFFHELILC